MPFSDLLSQAFVALTIETDNEFEHRMPHRTAADRGNPGVTGPWLTSLAFWSNHLRFIGDAGISAGRLAALAGDGREALASRLHELRRWGYVRVESTADGQNAADRMVRLTDDGARARAVWAPLDAEIEQRWRQRFGDDRVDKLRSGLVRVLALRVEELPLGFPVLAWDRATRGAPWLRNSGRARPAVRDTRPPDTPRDTEPEPDRDSDPDRDSGRDTRRESGREARRDSRREARRVTGRNGFQPARPELSTLFSRVLLAFALDFDGEAPASLALTADLLRLLGDTGTGTGTGTRTRARARARTGIPVSSLPILCGVSKEAIAIAVGRLERGGQAVVDRPAASPHTRLLRLTPDGRELRDGSLRALDKLEQDWRSRFDTDDLAETLNAVVGDRMRDGLRPYPDGWRARTPYLAQTTATLADPRSALPHFPMVTHRGGYPDGS